jgi:hypothetical protein
VQAIELDRQQRHLEALDDRSFLRELGTWLMLAEEGRSSGWVLADLRAEYTRTLDAYLRADDETLLLLVDIRDQIARLSGRPVMRWTCEPPTDEGTGRAHALVTSLRREFRTLRDEGGEPARPLADLARDFEQIAAQHRRRHSSFVGLLHGSASGSLRRLDWLAEEIELRQPLESTREGPSEGTLEDALASVRPLLRAAVSRRVELTPSERRQLAHIVTGARVDAARVHERVMRRAHAEEWSVQRHLGAEVGNSRRRARGRCS